MRERVTSDLRVLTRRQHPARLASHDGSGRSVALTETPRTPQWPVRARAQATWLRLRRVAVALRWGSRQVWRGLWSFVVVTGRFARSVIVTGWRLCVRAGVCVGVRVGVHVGPASARRLLASRGVAAQRRKVVVMLVALTLSVSLVGAIGPPPVAVALVPLLMLIAYLVLLRHLVDAQRRRAARTVTIVPAQWLPRPRVVRPRALPEPLPPEEPAVVAASATAGAAADTPALAAVAAEELFPFGEPWEPVPVPLPMYVAAGAHTPPGRRKAGSGGDPQGVEYEVGADARTSAYRRHAVGD
ncbi:MAG: hypothetical protein H0W56_00005 [Acidothermales bacterium]|nr:hypothetical protein [Acidothermales bacterium]